MVSSVLAQAILNPNVPDLIGAFDKGRELQRGSRTRELTAQAVLPGGGEALAELQGVNPEVGFAIAEQISARSEKDVNDFIRDARIGKNLLEGGNSQGFLSFANQRREAIAARGGDTTQTDQFINLVQSGQSEQALQELTAFSDSIDSTKLTPRQRELREFKNLPTGTPEEREFKQQFGQGIGAIGKRAGIDEKVQLQRERGDIQVDQKIREARGRERVKLEEQIKDIPQRQRVQFLSKNKENFNADIDESRNVIDEINRAIQIWESAPGTISGPLASRLPSLSADTQELESILAQLGINRLSAFKGATSERELATAFRAGASIEQDKTAGIRRLKRQRTQIQRNNERLGGLLNEADNLLRRQPQEPQGAAPIQPAQQNEVFEVDF